MMFAAVCFGAVVGMFIMALMTVCSDKNAYKEGYDKGYSAGHSDAKEEILRKINDRYCVSNEVEN